MARHDAILRLHKTLMARRQELRKRLGIELDDLAHIKHSSASGDVADAAFDSSCDEMASTLAELEAKELAQVEHALRRLKGGTYGKCELCATRIPVARLNALPYSTVCIKCQRELELEDGHLQGRSPGDWGRIGEGGYASDDREVRLSDLEIDVSK